MKTYSIKELFDLISDCAYKKDLVEKSGVSNDKMTRLLDPNNKGRVSDLIDVLDSFGCQLCASRDGKIYPIESGS
jgi:hypothetical protein